MQQNNTRTFYESLGDYVVSLQEARKEIERNRDEYFDQFKDYFDEEEFEALKSGKDYVKMTPSELKAFIGESDSSALKSIYKFSNLLKDWNHHDATCMYGRETADKMFPLMEDGKTRYMAEDYNEIEKDAFADDVEHLAVMEECIESMYTKEEFEHLIETDNAIDSMYAEEEKGPE